VAQALPIETIAPLRAPSVAPARPRLRLVPAPATVDPRARAAALYLDYGPAVYRRCRRLLRDREAASDATQEVFLRLVRHGEALSARHDLLPWLFRVATNHCLNVLRDARGRQEELVEVEDEAAEGARASTPGDRLLRRVLAQFDEATQAIAVGVIVEGLEAEEMARQLGVSRRTVSRKLDRFLAQARHRLTGGTPGRAR